MIHLPIEQLLNDVHVPGTMQHAVTIYRRNFQVLPKALSTFELLFSIWRQNTFPRNTLSAGFAVKGKTCNGLLTKSWKTRRWIEVNKRARSRDPEKRIHVRSDKILAPSGLFLTTAVSLMAFILVVCIQLESFYQTTENLTEKQIFTHLYK